VAVRLQVELQGVARDHHARPPGRCESCLRTNLSSAQTPTLQAQNGGPAARAVW
jgi:hypothetical protein